MGKKNAFRRGMIPDAQKASTAMQTSPIAKQLKSNGFTTATMAAEASALSNLHAAAAAARNAWLQASAALQTKAQSFDEVWSSYCNIVRGVTSDATTRKAHGVSSPGIRKSPTFKRGPRKAASAATPAVGATPAKPQ
jgi:hypothetical protein